MFVLWEGVPAARIRVRRTLVFLPETDREGAIAAARFRREIEDERWEQRPMTVSVGAATLPLCISSQAKLVEQADKSLYTSKADGRNRAAHDTTLTPAAA